MAPLHYRVYVQTQLDEDCVHLGPYKITGGSVKRDEKQKTTIKNNLPWAYPTIVLLKEAKKLNTI